MRLRNVLIGALVVGGIVAYNVLLYCVQFKWSWDWHV